MADEAVVENSVGDVKEDVLEDSPVHTTLKDSPENLDVNSGNPSEKDYKVEILLKQSGSAPIIQKKKWTVPVHFRIFDVQNFIRQYMKLDDATSLFLYVNQAFAPCPDDRVGNVFRCFNTSGRLVLYYSTTTAWG